MQKNTTLATEILKEQVRCTRLWRTAFVVVIVDRITGKGR